VAYSAKEQSSRPPPTTRRGAPSRVADRLRGTAGDLRLFQLAFGEETDPLAVGREERASRSGGPFDRTGFDLVQRPQEELARPAAFGRVDEPPTIPRKGQDRNVVVREAIPRGNRNREGGAIRGAAREAVKTFHQPAPAAAANAAAIAHER